MILQWAETQIDAAHAPAHLPGPLHGHTWFVRAARAVDPAHYTPSVVPWHLALEQCAAAFDHRELLTGENLAEELAAKIGQVLGCAEVDVWRFIRGGKVGATWRA